MKHKLTAFISAAVCFALLLITSLPAASACEAPPGAAGQSTLLEIGVADITVNCGPNGSYKVQGISYNKTETFRLVNSLYKGKTFVVEAKADQGYTLDTPLCSGVGMDYVCNEGKVTVNKLGSAGLISFSFTAEDSQPQTVTHKVSVKLGTGGCYIVGGVKYTGARSFELAAGSSFIVSGSPYTSYKLQSVVCSTASGESRSSYVTDGVVTIPSLQEDLVISYTFKWNGGGTVVYPTPTPTPTPTPSTEPENGLFDEDLQYPDEPASDESAPDETATDEAEPAEGAEALGAQSQSGQPGADINSELFKAQNDYGDNEARKPLWPYILAVASLTAGGTVWYVAKNKKDKDEAENNSEDSNN